MPLPARADALRTRPPLDRMMRIHERLADDRCPNCSTLARELEVSTKTVLRDLEFMRDRLHLPIGYDSSRRAYRYTGPVNAFPTLQVSEGEVFALLIAQRALEQYRGTPFHAQLASTFAKLTAALDEKISFDPAVASTSISFSSLGNAAGDPIVFDVLSRCVRQRHEVSFGYRKPDAKEAEARRVRPYHLAHRNGLWYLVGHDVNRNAIRHFALPRIVGVKRLAARFSLPNSFDPAAHFRSAFGASVGEPGGRVEIRFDAVAAPYIRERAWHDTQRIEPAKDGGVTLRMEITDFEEVERWVLSWGRHAEVVAPAELRASVREAAEIAARQHRD